MPQETLNFPAAYVVVGAYRLANDALLWKPMWKEISGAAKKAGTIAVLWALLTWPIQRTFVGLFMSGSSRVLGLSGLYHNLSSKADKLDDSLPFIIPLPSLQGFATFMFVLSQCSAILEVWLRRRLRSARSKAYAETVRSRGKSVEWWTEYGEEWEEPPIEKAKKRAQKQSFYAKLATPLLRFFVFKVLLLPLDWVPFLSLFVSAWLRSLSLGRQLHQPFFQAKRMTPFQIELWLTERTFAYYQFGFAAALLEHIPVLGLVFSISNRVGAAMYAHDLEKRQQLLHTGQLRKLSKEETYSLRDPRKPSSPRSSQRGKLAVAPQAEEDFHMPGATLGNTIVKDPSVITSPQVSDDNGLRERR